MNKFFIWLKSLFVKSTQTVLQVYPQYLGSPHIRNYIDIEDPNEQIYLKSEESLLSREQLFNRLFKNLSRYASLNLDNSQNCNCGFYSKDVLHFSEEDISVLKDGLKSYGFFINSYTINDNHVLLVLVKKAISHDY